MRPPACWPAKDTFRWPAPPSPRPPPPITGSFNPAVKRDHRRQILPAGDHPAAGDGKVDFHFSMSVTRIHEDPRVTKPYTEEQWAQIESLGHQIDSDLKRGDVRLTMGGEPTFVSIDDMDGPEWNSEALGPAKYKQADELIRRLRDRFAIGGFLHHGQGKWYPGESLPRWSMGLYWRKDGEPIWNDPRLVADEKTNNHATENDARAFALRLAERLGVEGRFVLPGFEDVWYYLWKERRLPVNVDPLESKLDNPLERKRLAQVFEQGLDKVIGYALPLAPRTFYRRNAGRGSAVPWFLRTERMYLVPGDSPMGYRLPLDSIPWMVKTPYPTDPPLDPWAARGPLPGREAIGRQRYIAGAPSRVIRRTVSISCWTPHCGRTSRRSARTRARRRALFRRSRVARPPPSRRPWACPLPGWCARHSAPKCAAACCASSCRPRDISKIISS